MTESDHVIAPFTDTEKSALPWKEKTLIAGLMILQIPLAVIFFPLAAVFVLTGILAPLGVASFAVATKPTSLALRRRSTWRSRQHGT